MSAYIGAAVPGPGSVDRSRSEMKPTAVILLAVLVAGGQAAPKPPKLQLPGSIKRCDKADPDYEKCSLLAVQQMLDLYSGTGFPEFGVPPLDPYFLPEMTVEYVTSETKGTMILRNTTSTGGKQLKVKAIRHNLVAGTGKIEVEVDVELAKMVAQGSYDSRGVFVFPINGGGVYNVTALDISGTAKMQFSTYLRKTVRHLRLDHFLFRPKIGNMVIYASNLYTGNKDLNKAALVFVNQNWKALYEEMGQYASEAGDLLAVREVNRILSKVALQDIIPKETLDEMFPTAPTPKLVAPASTTDAVQAGNKTTSV